MSPHAELSLLDLTGIIRKKFNLFLTLFLVVFIGAGLVTLVMPQAYKATAKVLIRQDIKIYPDELVSVDRPEAYLTTQKEIMSSRIVVEEALSAVQAKGILKGSSYDDIRDDVTVSYLNDSDILAVDVVVKAPRDAAELANALVGAFIAYHKKQQVSFVDSTLGVLESELGTIQRDINIMKEKINQFGGSEQVEMYLAQVPQYVDKMLSVSEATRESEIDLARLKDQLKRTNAILSKGSDSIFFPLLPYSGQGSGENPMASMTSIPWIRDIKARMAEIQEKFAVANAEYTETSPEVVELNSQMEALRDNLNRELQGVYSAYADYYGTYIGTLEGRIAQHDQARKLYQSKLDDIKAQVQQASSRKVEQMMLLDNYEAVETVQAALLKKQKELQYLKGQVSAADLPTIRVFEQAYIPRKPARPNLALNLSLGCLLGLFIGFLGCLLSEKPSASSGYAALPGGSALPLERRSMKRVDTDMDVSFSIGEESKVALLSARSANISGSGINLKLKKTLPVGTDLYMEIRTADKQTVRASGRIVWSDESRRMPFNTGVCFTKIDSTEREKLIQSIYGDEFRSFA